jgi:hypothetical protein
MPSGTASADRVGSAHGRLISTSRVPGCSSHRSSTWASSVDAAGMGGGAAGTVSAPARRASAVARASVALL